MDVLQVCGVLSALAVVAATLASVRATDDYRKLIDWTWLLYGLLLASVWISSVILPNEAWEHIQGQGLIGVQLNGAMPLVSANSVGEIGAVLSIVSICRLLSRHCSRSFWVRRMITSLITMIMAQTRSAIGGFLAGFFLVLLMSNRLNLAPTRARRSACFTDQQRRRFLVDLRVRGQTVEEFQHASSRVDWWQVGWQKFLRATVGDGAYAGGRFVVMERLGGISNMHSTVCFEIILGTGIIGLIPVLIALYATWSILIGVAKS